MALPLINNQEGGTNGVLVTAGSTGNSGGDSGSYFNGVAGDVRFSAEHPGAGVLGLKCAQDPVTAGQARVQWNTQVGTLGSGTTVYARCYVYWPALPSPAQSFYQGSAAVGGIAYAVRLQANGTVVILDSAGAVAYTSTLTLPLNTLIRVETKVVIHATTGRVLSRFYYDDGTGKTAQGTTEVFTLGSDVTNVATRGTVDQINHGLMGVSTGNTVYISDIEANDSGWPGPSALASEPDWYRLADTAWRAAGQVRRLSGGAWV